MKILPKLISAPQENAMKNIVGLQQNIEAFCGQIFVLLQQVEQLKTELENEKRWKLMHLNEGA